MVYIISEDCLHCGSCADECQIKAIKEEDRNFTIDQDVCVECGACLFVCDVGAIVMEQ